MFLLDATLKKSIATHLPPPRQCLYYFQLAVFLYFILFYLYYDRKYAKSEHLQVTSAVYEPTSNRLTLVFYFLEPGVWDKDIFLIQQLSDGRNDTKLELEPVRGLAENGQIMTWSSEIDNLGGISLTAEHSKSAKLEEHTGRPALEIFPQEPYSNPHDVVTCYSPIFENYEMVLSSLTTSIAMGAFVHLPYEELPGELYKFLKVFEKSGHLRLSGNPLLRHPPRIGSPLKIQALKTDLAHLNCHLMYRSSAKFMIFQNSDDIVLPILPGGNYLSEFSTIFQAPRVKGYSILEYNAQVSVDDVSHGEFADFSVRKAMGTVRIQAKGKDGESKALVIKMTPPTENDSKTQIVVDLGVLARFSVESEQSTTALNTAHAKMYTSRNLKIFPKIQENIFQKINEIIDKMEGVDEFWTLLKSCQFDAKRSTWKCSSEKCIRPRIRHRSLHGWYSYDIHFSLFARVDSFDC